jgi:hypothetical protein
MMEDSLAEDRHSPVPGLVHRYPDRVLMLVTTQCASYCRYCTRSRIVGDPGHLLAQLRFEMQIEYLKRTPQVRDVLLSGGDPLTMAPKMLEELLSACAPSRTSRSSASARACRSSCPCASPTSCATCWRSTTLVDEHPRQPSQRDHPELAEACDDKLARRHPAGQPVRAAGRRQRLPHIQRKLVQDLVRIRVRPYYLYQCDLVEGAGHFRTPVSKGIEIIEGLRGHTSGYAVPTYVVDAPGGGGKIPVMPNYMISSSDHKVVLRNYEGYITTYEEPTNTPLPTQTEAGVLPSPTPVPPTATPFVIVPPTTVVSSGGSSSGGSGGGGSVPINRDYVCDAINKKPADNTVFKPDADFDVKWTIVNTGTKDLRAGLDLKYFSGPQMTTLTRVELPALKPGEKYEVILDAEAPTKPGFHVMTWMVEGQLCYPYIAINVQK